MTTTIGYLLGISGYVLGVLGTCFINDGLISIRLYRNAKDETGKKMQDFWHDHIIRVLRCIGGLIVVVIGIALMVMGYYLV